MIAKTAISKFLNRKLDNWEEVKELTELETWEAIDASVPSEFGFKTLPWLHQSISFLAGIENKEFLFLLDMGGGKSKCIMDVFSYYKETGEYTGKTLIMAPNDVSMDGWAEQIETHSDFTYTALMGDKDQKWKIFEESDTDFYIITYAGLLPMLSKLVQKLDKDGNEIGKRELKPIDKLVKKFATSFQGIVPDEIHFCKNHQSLSYKLVNKIAKECTFRYGLTGTPMGRDPIDLWAQFFLIDRGETLGTTLGMYREVFFKKESSFFGSKWVFDNRMEEDLYRVMKHRSIRYSEEEFKDRPPKVYSTAHINFPSENYQYYEQAKNKLLSAKGDFQAIDNAYMRMRQIVSGYIDFKDDEGNRERIIFKENYRLDTLLDDIQNTPARAKIIVFVGFTPSGDMIEERLKKAKINYRRLYSKTKDKQKAVDDFKTDKKVKVLLTNYKSGGTALNLQVADWELFYESPESPIVRAQSEKRAPRGDKKRTTYIRDYVVKGSVDEDIMGFLKEGKDLFSSLIEGKAVIK